MKSTYSLAVVGAESSIMLFQAIGAEVHAVYSAEETKDKILELMTTYQNEADQIPKYAVVFIDEEWYKTLPDEVIERSARKSLPALVPLPALNSSDKNFAQKRLSSIVERAIGSDILS